MNNKYEFGYVLDTGRVVTIESSELSGKFYSDIKRLIDGLYRESTNEQVEVDRNKAINRHYTPKIRVVASYVAYGESDKSNRISSNFSRTSVETFVHSKYMISSLVSYCDDREDLYSGIANFVMVKNALLALPVGNDYEVDEEIMDLLQMFKQTDTRGVVYGE